MSRHWIHLCLWAAVVGGAVAPSEADARRFGGGSSSGMKRTLPEQPARPGQPQQQPSTPPQQQAAPNAQSAQAGTAAAAAAPAARRSWLGPIAGLAAGFGLAALFSHLGLGAELANFVMLALLALAAFFVVRWVMGRMRAPRLAGAHAAAAPRSAAATPPLSTLLPPLPPLQPVLPARTAVASAPAPASSPALPAGFDPAAFERAAKQIFIRLQEAHDVGDLDDLRRFTTPEMYASAKLDMMERKGARQQTEVLDLHAEVIDLAREQGHDVVSVRYRGLVREEEGTGAQPFDEVWHLARGGDGRSDWVIAGIQQIA